MRTGLVALITDFGTEDGYVGAMKGRIKSIAPDVTIIDVSHNIAPFNIRQGAFCLSNCYPYFPDKTVFVAVVDPGVGSDRAGIVIKSSQHYFVGPDNGIFSFVNYREGYQAFEIDEDRLDHPISPTFHGRDVFAPMAAWIADGANVDHMLKRVKSVQSFLKPPQQQPDNRFTVQVMHIDHFGNLILNFHYKDWLPLESKSELIVEIGQLRLQGLVTTFGEAQPGEIRMMWDSSGFLQIAKNLAGAADELNASVGDEYQLWV